LNITSNEIFALDIETLLFEHVNSRALKNLEYQFSEIILLKATDIIEGIGQEELARWVGLLRSNKKDEITFNASHRRKDGSFYPVKTQLKLDYLGSSPLSLGLSRMFLSLGKLKINTIN